MTSTEIRNTDEMVPMVDRVLRKRSLADEGDTIVIVAGTPLAVAGRTNLLRLHTIGDPGIAGEGAPNEKGPGA